MVYNATLSIVDEEKIFFYLKRKTQDLWLLDANLTNLYRYG